MNHKYVNSLSMKYFPTPLPDGSSEEKILPEGQAAKEETASSILAALLGGDDKKA